MHRNHAQKSFTQKMNSAGSLHFSSALIIINSVLKGVES
jgi:hypothetical protein